MKIKDIIDRVDTISVVGEVDDTLNINSLSFDSRSVERGSCFFAIRGTRCDGHNFIAAVVRGGASVVVCEEMVECDHVEADVCFVVVESSERAMADVARLFYGDPSREIELVGVTGTNGKSTTATLLADLFEELGYKTGLISTVTYRIAGNYFTSTHTTPDTIRLNAMLRQMVDAGCSYCFMEVSSHSIVQERIAGFTFAGAIFTNLTHDHLDYHGTFMEYLKAKRSLFDRLPKGSFAVVNVDDRNGEVMVQNSRAKVVKYSSRRVADHTGRVVEMHFDGMLLSIDGRELWVKLIGGFNLHNLLAIYSTALELGMSSDEVLVAMSRLESVRGRFENFAAAGGRTIIIDYAHTPDALKVTLSAIGEMTKSTGCKIITVCGCGGDRDREKRPDMARIAYNGSSTAIFTSDNPRNENPESILEDMVVGVLQIGRSAEHRWLKITDRAEAIRTAVMLSEDGDVILIAGKGHETYQIIGESRHHFDDLEEAKQAVTQYLK
ncbi:MAG: UDP-N-acetylmuramoyl-L-alanyl-D-glutamate--2,6-diaminopimelate ligase [Rikenellaceae bacterium]